MVRQNENSRKSRVIAGTPMYRLVNKIAIGFAGIVGVYHVGINAGAYYSGYFEKHKEFFTAGEEQLRERAGVLMVLRESSSEMSHEQFVDTFNVTPIGKVLAGVKNLCIATQDAIVAGVNIIVGKTSVITETSNTAAAVPAGSEPSSKEASK